MQPKLVSFICRHDRSPDASFAKGSWRNAWTVWDCSSFSRFSWERTQPAPLRWRSSGLRSCSVARTGSARVRSLANQPLLTEKQVLATVIFVIAVSATIILVSALSSFLYHYGILARGERWPG
jgi:hypothetical protein